jgi:hypothetical protein
MEQTRGEETMTREDAVKAINDLVQAEVALMKQMNARGWTTKEVDRRERKAVNHLFEALTGGEVATDKEVQEMIGV